MKKGIGLGIGAGLIIVLAGLGYQIAKKSRKQFSETEEKIKKIADDIEDIVELVKNDPEKLLKGQMCVLLAENTWRNERDFLECLNRRLSELIETKDFGILPKSQEDLLERLRNFGLLEEFERELEKKYERH